MFRKPRLTLSAQSIDRGFLIAPDHSKKARRIIRKLSESCDKLPSSLFVAGITGREERPTFGGGFGDIFRACYGTQTVALKRMRYFTRGDELRRIRLKLCREALVWKDLHHPNILPFLGIDRDSFPSELCMVSPWMEHGIVLDYLKVHQHANVHKMLLEIVQGLEYLHSQNIVHGDLRGANILITENSTACLADFGLSVFTDATASLNSDRAGCIYWMAPELIDPEYFGCTYARTPASDIYAFGCVCLELYTGRAPFAELLAPTAMLKVIHGQRADRPTGNHAMSDMLWEYVTSYWAENPATRPSTLVVVQHMAERLLDGPRRIHPYDSEVGDLPFSISQLISRYLRRQLLTEVF
ncbi:kinase-like domain-containing protein [Mycena galericulata]|nr:kinase-like domain-containing protein [Mycena galericulata]